MEAPDSVVTRKTPCVKKVSKPLMERKRRARINKCLNQLKSLLESVYSNNIRKRKFEKADILEMTVKHLRHLQNTKRGTSTRCDSTEYQAGYRSCLAGVSHYLFTSDIHNDSLSIMLAHPTSGLSRATVPDFSTADSDTAMITAPTLCKSLQPSLKRDVPYVNLQQNSDRYHHSMPKRIEICDMDRISFDAQVGTPGSKRLITRHSSLQNANADQSYIFSRASQQNYWRPW